MASGGRERRLRQKRKKREAQKTEELAAGDTDEAVSPSGGEAIATGNEYASRDFSAEDMAYIREYERTPNWVIKGSLLTTLPNTLDALSRGMRIEDGKEVPDERATPQTMAAAAARIVQMQGQVLAHANRAGGMQHSIHRHYLSRHSHAQTPEADPESVEKTNEGMVIDSPSFRESTTLEESEEVLVELDQLGLLGVLLGKDDDRSGEEGGGRGV